MNAIAFRLNIKNFFTIGYGFITFDSQSVADKVKEMERIKYNDEIELAIGPARIRKKRFYLLPTPQYQQPQAYYTQDGAVFWATCVPQQQVMQQPQIVSPVQVVHQSPNPPSYPAPQPVSQAYAPVAGQPAYTSPIQQQQYTTPVQQSFTTPQPNFGTPMGQNYGTPVVFSVVTSEPGNASSPSTPCMYQSKTISHSKSHRFRDTGVYIYSNAHRLRDTGVYKLSETRRKRTMKSRKL